MTTFTNDFKDMGAHDDPLVIKGQQEVVLAAISRVMFCMITKKMLDRSSTVVLMTSSGRTIAIDSSVWDSQQDDVLAVVAAHSGKIEVYDGRELW